MQKRKGLQGLNPGAIHLLEIQEVRYNNLASEGGKHSEMQQKMWEYVAPSGQVWLIVLMASFNKSFILIFSHETSEFLP